jgi:succinate-semialdehyde dehydrogenase/glutarate-semialdehyde dehydrogenase
MDAAIAAAADAAVRWSETRVDERAQRLTALAGALSQRSGSLQHVISSEIARSPRESCAEVRKSAAYARWLAANARHIVAPRYAAGARIHHRPLGVVAGITPWNFPVWQVVRFAAAALAGGNVVIVKHSPLVPRCAEALNDIFAIAGFDRGVFFCESGSASVARRLIADDRVRAIAFTGSAETGREIASLAGRHLKKCILELGGSDAFIVMPTGDVGEAARLGVESRLRASGQACTAAKRFLVHESIADEFEERFVSAMQSATIGPLISEAAADRLERQVRESHGKILCGGKRISPRVFEATALRVNSVAVPVMQEETFGPVAPILRFRDIDGAIEAANASPFGLSASIWSEDENDIDRFRSRLEVGQIFINMPAASRIDLPFGGVKASGYGRALADAGVYEFVNVTTEVRAWF